MLMLMEHISVVWMEKHLNLVHNLMIYNCIFMCFLLLTGFPGSMYSGLSDGQHMIDVQFTPTGSTQVTTFQLQFNIGNYLFCVSLSIQPLLNSFANDNIGKYSM